MRQARSRRKVFAFRGQLAQHGAKDAEKMLRILVRSQYRLLVFILNLPKQKGTYPSAMHLASLESHHREDLPRAPSLVVTVFSRSTWDGTQVSLFLLPVIARHGCAVMSKTNRLRRTDARRSPAFLACRITGSRRNVKDMLIFNFQGAEVVCLIEEQFYPSTFVLLKNFGHCSNFFRFS